MIIVIGAHKVCPQVGRWKKAGGGECEGIIRGGNAISICSKQRVVWRSEYNMAAGRLQELSARQAGRKAAAEGRGCGTQR